MPVFTRFWPWKRAFCHMLHSITDFVNNLQNPVAVQVKYTLVKKRVKRVYYLMKFFYICTHYLT